jgi:signal transduction histidine kinase
MKKPEIPDNEKDRLIALGSYDILDTLDHQEYDDIVLVASEICQTPISVISLIDENRQWLKSTKGINAKETSRDISFCGHAINKPDDVLIIPDARIDERFHDNPLVTGNPNIVFYAGVPLVDENGYALGTICVIDNKPKTLDENQIKALKVLARKVILLLSLKKRNTELESAKNLLFESINFSSPFFLLIDKNNCILDFGENYKKSIPELKKQNYFNDLFVWESNFNIESFINSNSGINKLLFFKTIDDKQRYKCSVKKYNADSLIIFATPVINTQYLITNYNININNFPKQDYIAEFLFLQQAATKGLEDSRRLTETLTEKNKLLEISKQTLINSNAVLEEKVNERTKKIKNLALFPEQNPNPVFELDYYNKVINYSNPAGKTIIFKDRSFTYEDLLKILIISEETIKNKSTAIFEFDFENQNYQRNIFFFDNEPIIRVYLHNITDIRNYQNTLKEKNEELELTLKQVVNLQTDIIKQEKMATLGLLIAGIAHEINTPLGAIKASNDNIVDSISNGLINQITQLDINDLVTSIELYFLNKKGNKVFSTREERAFIKRIEEELINENFNFSNTYFYARKIYELGFENLDTSLKKYLEHKNSADIFTFASNLLKIIKSTETITIAVDKATKVVKALNNFSHGNINDESVIFNLKDNIESVLTILWNKIKHGSKVINHISDDISIKGNQEELSQVWTNIINNALQAANNKCNIEISYYAENSNHIITLQNDGPEIPPNVIDRIFDEFFTTKKRGEGTGLGLNIVKKIIEKHKGTIKCTSNSSVTKFIISIPVLNE